MAMVELEPVPAEEDVNERVYHHRNDLETRGRVEILTDMTQFDAERLRYLIGQHARFTGSKRAAGDPRRLEELSAASSAR